MKTISINYDTIENIEWENIRGYPDFSDAFIAKCDIDGRDATDAELDEINSDSQLVYELLIDYLY